MDGMLLRTSVNSFFCHPQAGQQQGKNSDFNNHLASCSSFTPNTISHSLTSRPASSAIISKSKSSQMKRAAGVAYAAVQTGEIVDMSAFESITIYTTDGAPVKFSELWDQKNGKAVVAFLRHFGCPFCWEFAAALREAKPKFDAAGFKLITIGVGPSSKAEVLAERLPFPAECLYADPDRKAYDALGLYHGVARTWLNPASMQIFTRLDKVAEAVKGWNLDVMPDNTSATLQQGGVYVFEGSRVLYARKDESTGDHSKIDDILNSCCSTVMA
ncbi:hypothetical protein KC19_5G202200 [Ceratodon purpureus]|uniref:Thioredoxin domain-containing protein n=1 Tax=Ceratodon purpureus TaxID=3225 RepID=A0A8T0I538_CERPU|nr:hypothetical protein KC19_5G202200 [Ceratodon purpureus]